MSNSSSFARLAINASSDLNPSNSSHSSNHTNATSIWQEILSLDAKYNLNRNHNNSQLRTLYMRRRTQLLRENSMKYSNENKQIRRTYLNLRSQILERKYGQFDTISLSNSKTSKTHSKAPSMDSTSLNFDSWRSSNGNNENNKRLMGYTSFSSTLGNGSNNLNSFAMSANKRTSSSMYSSKESLTSITTTTNPSTNSITKLKTSTLEETYSFAGVHHVFNNHKGSVTRIRFANNDRSLLASCSTDGSLVICQVIPSPATTIYKLEGHQSGIMDMQWSITNDLIVTASLDGTARVWQVTKGNCMRVLKDTCGAQVLSCCFQPLNENMIFTGNSKGLIQVYNLSTGIIANKNCVQKVNGRVQTMCFDSMGAHVWVGDSSGSISAFQFDIFTLKLNKTRKVFTNPGYSITSLAHRQLNAKESALLVNAMPNYLLLYKLINADPATMRLRKRIAIRQTEHSLRSVFCPIVSKRQQSSVLVCTGSEDASVCIYDMDNDEKQLVNRLVGHEAPVLDVTINYDRSLLASGDSQVYTRFIVRITLNIDYFRPDQLNYA